MKQSLAIIVIILMGSTSGLVAQNLLTGGNMEDGGSWDTVWVVPSTHDVNLEFNYTSSRPSYGKGASLYISSYAGQSEGLFNIDIMIYHPVTLTPGKTYFIGGAFRDAKETGLANFWSEIALSPNNPKDSLKGGMMLLMAMNTWKGCGAFYDGTFHEGSCRYEVADPNDPDQLVPNTYFHVPDTLEGDQTYYLIIETGTWDDSKVDRSIEYMIDEMGVYDSASADPSTLYVYDPLPMDTLDETVLGIGNSLSSGDFGLAIHPNPSVGPATVSFHLSEPGEVRLEVFNVLGQKEKTLLEGFHDAGKGEVQFDTHAWTNNIYLVVLKYNGEVRTQKLIIK